MLPIMICGFMVYAGHVTYGYLLYITHHPTYDTDHQKTSVNSKGINYT